MVLGLECQQKVVGSFLQEEELKVVKDFQHSRQMTKLESLKKNSHFEKVLKSKFINNELYTIYCAKDLLKERDKKKKLHISFVMKKKIGNAVKRNRIKRKLKSIVQKLLKINSIININYTYVIFGKSKVYEKDNNQLFEKMKKNFKEMSA